MRKIVSLGVLLLGMLMLAACNINTGDIAGAVPTSSDSSTDPSAVQQFLPNIPGYIVSDANSIIDALTAAGAGASLISGNPVAAALIAQIDGMIACYQRVGAVGARIYTQADIGQILEGQVPVVGALAMVNQNRVVDNFLPCALGGLSENFSAQAAVDPCSGSGSFVVNNETILYLYAATQPELCTLFDQYVPG